MEFVRNGDFQLPLLGLGTFSMHGSQLNEVVSNALSLGYGLFDTATKYGNESDLGPALKGAQVLLQSKVHAAQLLGDLKCLRLNKKSVSQSFKLSSERLGVTPDIYLIHSPFQGYERHFADLVSLRDQGMVKAVGVCNVGLEQLKGLINTTGQKPDVVQAEIHPYHNNKALIMFCKEQGILVEARSPLAHGDVMQEWLSKDVFQRIASNYGKRVPQVILRWITQQDVVTLVRSTRLDHLEENSNIFDFSLSEKEMDDIDSLNKNLSFGFVSSKR